MRIEYTGRGVDLTPALKEHVEEKLGHAARSLGDVIEIHVVLAVEKYRHMAEILIKRRKGSLNGQAATRDMYQSIQKAIERIEKQVRRKREKVITGRRRGHTAKEEVLIAAAASVPAPAPRPSGIDRRRVRRVLRVVDEAPDRVKPIGIDEALLLLEDAERPFVVFRNVSSGRVAVLYRRPDGQVGCIEPKV